MAAVRVPLAGFAPKAFGNTLPRQGNTPRLDANRRMTAWRRPESNRCSDFVRRNERDWISFNQIVFNARYRGHPHRPKARAYRNANEIRAHTGYPLTVLDKPRSLPIRSAVTAADGM